MSYRYECLGCGWSGTDEDEASKHSTGGHGQVRRFRIEPVKGPTKERQVSK